MRFSTNPIWRTLIAAGMIHAAMFGEVYASGFAMPEQGAAASGNAGAHTGVQNSVDAAFFNPASVALMPGFQAQLSGAFLFSKITHEGEEITESQTPPGTPPALKLAWAHELQSLRIGVTAYAGVPFGSGVTWPDTWPGRFDITSIALRVYEANINPVMGFSSGDWSVGLGAGPRVLRASVGLTRKLDAVENEANVELAGLGTAWAWQGSAIIAFQNASLGVNYRSGADVAVAGRAHFEDVPVELSNRARDQDVQTTLPVPSRLAIGAAYTFGFGRVSLDAERLGWSVFEAFQIDFAHPETPDVDERRDWNDTWTWRLGYEHTGITPPLALRAGLAFDPTPSPIDTLSPTLPDSDRLMLTLGGGWKLDPFPMQINAAYGYTHLLPKTPTNPDVLPGNIFGRIHTVSLGVSIHL